jgi:hypothetical protein
MEQALESLRKIVAGSKGAESVGAVETYLSGRTRAFELILRGAQSETGVFDTVMLQVAKTSANESFDCGAMTGGGIKIGPRYPNITGVPSNRGCNRSLRSR